MADFALTFADGTDAYTFTNPERIYDNFADMVPQTARLPLLDGGFDMFGADPAPASIGRITVTFVIAVDHADTMQAQLDAIKELAHLGLRKLYFQPQGSAATRWCWARVNTLPMSLDADNGLVMQRLAITFQVPDPYWHEDETSQAISASGTSTDATVTHDGNAPALARVVVACGAGQTAENPTVQRMVNSVAVDEMAYTGVLAASDSLEMDAQAKSVELNDADAYDDFGFNHPDWLRLMPGDNTIRVTFANAGDAATVTVYWYPTYR